MEVPESHGKMSVRELMGKDQGANTMDINNGNIRDFDRMAAKYNIDYAIKRIDQRILRNMWCSSRAGIYRPDDGLLLLAFIVRKTSAEKPLKSDIISRWEMDERRLQW